MTALVQSVLALDPGQVTGWAHYPSGDAGTIRLKERDGLAFKEFGRRFDEALLNPYQPDMIVVEAQMIVGRGARSVSGRVAMSSGRYAIGVHAIVWANAGEILVDEVRPMEWQRWAKHRGWRKKNDIEDAKALLAYALAVRVPLVVSEAA